VSDTFSTFTASLRDFMRCSLLSNEGSELVFSRLVVELFALQFEHNAAYRRWCERRCVKPETVRHWHDVPSIPAGAFKELELTSIPESERSVTFQSSGTTGQVRSRHFHHGDSLKVYEASLLPWFERHLLADLPDLMEEQLLGPLDKLPMLALTPGIADAPGSSLVYMFDVVAREFGARDSLFCGRIDAATGAWQLDMERALFAIRKSMCANRPLVMLGTAFSFVQLLDHFAANNMRYRLAKGSRVLETGGYKGQAREIPKGDLHTLIGKHLGIAPDYIVTEYGMSELSSQAYDISAGSNTERVFRFPPWARCRIVSPETGKDVAEGESGLVQIFDLANVWSVMAIQTEDLAVRRRDGFELLGRASKAEPRGCSLMTAELRGAIQSLPAPR
jgi:hypothetical protein